MEATGACAQPNAKQRSSAGVEVALAASPVRHVTPSADVIAAIAIGRVNGQSQQELCAMGGITLEELSQSESYREN